MIVNGRKRRCGAHFRNFAGESCGIIFSELPIAEVERHATCTSDRFAAAVGVPDTRQRPHSFSTLSPRARPSPRPILIRELMHATRYCGSSPVPRCTRRLTLQILLPATEARHTSSDCCPFSSFLA